MMIKTGELIGVVIGGVVAASALCWAVVGVAGRWFRHGATISRQDGSTAGETHSPRR